MLSLSDVSYTIGNKTLLENISFRLNAGEHLVILGANGAGKSTLLKLCAGELAPASGEIQINGASLHSHSPKALARIRAVMPQDVQLHFPFRVHEVVAMGRSPHPKTEDDDELIQNCLQRFEVEHLEDRLYPTLSGGEKQRVQLARVFCQLQTRDHNLGPRHLFLDECTSALDPAHQYQVYEQVQTLVANNIATLSIMHDLNLAAQFADRILILRDGKMLCDGHPDDVLTQRHLSLAYGIQTRILPHPTLSRPLIVSCGRQDSRI